MKQHAPTIEDVYAYWNEFPLLSHELDLDHKEVFFEQLDRIKREDAEKFSIPYWEFDGYAGRKVLDVGCGPGWYTVNYARGGADVHAVDLTDKAVEIAGHHLDFYNLAGQVQQANAEELPFPDDTFDLVASSGVLHHTPRCIQAIKECRRVLRPGGKAKITLYRKGILHRFPVFYITLALMRLSGTKHPGADLAKDACDVDDFIRCYDGQANPCGIGKTDREWAKIMRECGFTVQGTEQHFFPKRFIKAKRLISQGMHRFLDSHFGTMIYFTMTKPSGTPDA